MNIREWWRRFAGSSRAPVASVRKNSAPVLPLRQWGAREITLALEPPVQGRDHVVLKTRFCCASALDFVDSFYRQVRPAIRDPDDWRRLEYELKMLIGQHGYGSWLFVTFVTTNDVALGALMARDQLFRQREIRPPLDQLALGEMRRIGNSADTLIAIVDPEDFERIFEPRAPGPPRAVIPM